jgi:hypothetical protein
MGRFVVMISCELNPVTDSGPFKLGCEGEMHVTEI